MSVTKFANIYRPPSSASVQPRAPMSGGTYGTLSRRASPGMNSATPFGYPAQSPGNIYGRIQQGAQPHQQIGMQHRGQQGVRPRHLLGTQSYTAEQAEGMQRVKPNNPFQMGVKLPFNVMQQMFPGFYNFDRAVHPLRHLNIPGAM